MLRYTPTSVTLVGESFGATRRLVDARHAVATRGATVQQDQRAFLGCQHRLAVDFFVRIALG